MNDNIRNEIKAIIEEQNDTSKNSDKYIINKIYREAWNFILTQLKKDYNNEYYLLPFLFFNIYGEKNKDNIDKAITLLKQDGFYFDEKSNILALRIKKASIIEFANTDTSTKKKMTITPFTENKKRK